MTAAGEAGKLCQMRCAYRRLALYQPDHAKRSTIRFAANSAAQIQFGTGKIKTRLLA
jgi:hypothetical protein